MPSSDDKAVLFEFVRQGDYVKVSAIDPFTNIEAVIVGSARMHETHLKQTALKKLRYMIEKARAG